MLCNIITNMLVIGDDIPTGQEDWKFRFMVRLTDVSLFRAECPTIKFAPF